ncbi:MAG: hypothetical protein OEZ00_08450 [Dehalococcoidia bacterium]|jgi:hypothetical protein|nr:hypothetical protein [Dehalococcoidia bacterium]
MGRRDYRRREPKKPKKGTQKGKPISEFVPQLETEVIKKKRKPAEEYEE